jgi:hypothetical protein
MAHVRTQIRDAVVTALTGLPTTGTRVFSGRARPMAKDSDPYWLVYATEERVDVHAMGADPVQERTLTLMVEGRAVASDAEAIEVLLDQIAAEGEPAIVRDASLGGRTQEVTLTAVRINVEAPGERHQGEVRMEFRVVYRTRESAPHIPL